MNRIIIVLVTAIGISVAASPAQADLPPESPWVLLGLDVFMGLVTPRDTARDADTVSVYGAGLPVFPTAAACQAALRHAIQKYAGRSHAEGNSGRYLCVDWRTWATDGAHVPGGDPNIPPAPQSAYLRRLQDAIAGRNGAPDPAQLMIQWELCNEGGHWHDTPTCDQMFPDVRHPRPPA